MGLYCKCGNPIDPPEDEQDNPVTIHIFHGEEVCDACWAVITTVRRQIEYEGRGGQEW